MIVGMLNTRPASDFLTPLIPHIGRMLCVTIPDTPASMQAEELAATARGLGIEAETAKDIHQALATARGLATANQPILITGSIYLAGRVLQEFGIVPG